MTMTEAQLCDLDSRHADNLTDEERAIMEKMPTFAEIEAKIVVTTLISLVRPELPTVIE